MRPGKARRHFLCTFRPRMDASGRTYYMGQLGNSRLLLYPANDGEMMLYLGPQLEVEKISLQDRFRGTNSSRACTDDYGKFTRRTR